ncbi:trypsin-like serine protease [Lachnospiraceae bacterium JC7]|nr:trypsin-like serine protease [Lachnospiraceae bacterium JC7]
MHQVFATFLLVYRELYIIFLMDDNDFIKENIVGRQESWKKRARHYARVTLSAVLFGTLSAGIFAVLEPKFAGHFSDNEPETVRFETEPETSEAETEEETTEETTKETEPETTQTEPETEEVPKETVSVENVVREEIRKYQYNVEDYERMNSALQQVAASADHSLVEVRSRETANDFFGQLVKSGKSSAGVVIARTSGEVLILTSDTVARDSGSIEAVFYGDKTYSASVKSVDEADGIAIVSVPLTSLSYRDVQGIRIISMGDSSMIRRGDMIIAVGAPAGVYSSSTVGSVASVAYNTVSADGNIKDMIADIDIDPSYGSFVLNTDGELVGWIKSDEKASEHGYEHIVGISDYLDVIETISNGTEFAYLGLKAQEMTQEMTEARLPEGLYIRESIQNSPAYDAGIQNGDVLVGINDKEIRKMVDYHEALRELRVGDEADVAIMRQNGAEYVRVHFTVTVAGR